MSIFHNLLERYLISSIQLFFFVSISYIFFLFYPVFIQNSYITTHLLSVCIFLKLVFTMNFTLMIILQSGTYYIANYSKSAHSFSIHTNTLLTILCLIVLSLLINLKISQYNHVSLYLAYGCWLTVSSKNAYKLLDLSAISD